jgi:6-phosphofructokinase 1
MEKGMRIAINTGGGDAPGLNAVIEAVVLSAYNRNWEVYGIKNGYAGLLNTDEIIRQDVVLGGVGEFVSTEIAKRTGKDTRSLVLGHLQRGGSPTTFDRLLALRFGAAAVRMIEKKNFGVMIVLDPPDVRAVPLEKVIDNMKRVQTDGDTVKTAREIGICFGD